MKALLCTALGPPEDLVLTEMPSPVPGPGQIGIAVKACGVNFPDVLMLQGRYQRKPPLPFAPGLEVAGIVTAAGDGVTGFSPGDRVCASLPFGGYAEEAVADAARAAIIPDSIDFDAAATLVLAYGTALYALTRRGGLTAGETLVVLGAAGGVGLAAVQLGAIMGAKVIAGVSSEEKLALARAQGATDGFVYPPLPLAPEQQRGVADTIKRMTGGGADVLFDPIGDAYAEPALRAMAHEGRYLVVGFAAGEIPRIPLNLVLLKGCDIRGALWATGWEDHPEQMREDLRLLLQWTASGALCPAISARIPLARGHEAIRLLQDRKVTGKAVIIV